MRLDVADCESLFLEVTFKKDQISENTSTDKTILLGCIYRHPRWQTSLFIEELIEKLSIYTEKNIPIVALGDVNIDILVKSDRDQNYVNMLSSIGCQNLTDVPTCFEDESQSCLDHIITNIDQDKISHGVLDYSATNHLPIYTILSDITRSSKKNEDDDDAIEWRHVDDRKKETFLNILASKLQNIDLREHPEKILAALTSKTQEAINECFPLKTKTKSKRAKKRSLTPWFTTEIFKEEKTQSKLFRRFVKSNKPEDHQAYKNFRKQLSKKKYKAKRTYFHDLLKEAKNSEDKRATWDVINRAFGKNKKKRILPKKVNVGDTKNPKFSTSSQDVANVLNNHFTSIAENLAKNLGTTESNPMDFMGPENNQSMYLKLIEIHEILEEIASIVIKKAKGYDQIAPKIIKWASHLFAPVLLVIFNKCIDLGFYPGNMKIGEVAPIYKKGDQDGESNYRPITVLTQFNQIFERLLYKRYLSFFERFNIITKKQFGFLKKHCTEHAILDLKEFLMSKLDSKEVAAVLFLDLQKAFDTVSHDILLKKLHHYGVRGNAYQLLKSYLSGRMQRTKVKNALSDLALVLWGVPQGSVLGPLLFLIFINDLPNASDLISWLFADDTALALSSASIQELEIRFNYEVNKVHDWLLTNRLSVHYSDKTQYMLIQRPNLKNRAISSMNFKLFMGIHEIEKTNNYTYLGIIIDDKLNWKLQISKMCSKLSSVCGILSKVRHYLDRAALLLIYNSLFDSRLRYGILGWGTASNQHLSRLRVLQNRAIRFITFSQFRTSAAPLYSLLKILPLNEQFFLQKSIFMHSLHYKNLPFMLSAYCQLPLHRYATRYKTSENYVLPCPSTNRSQRSIKFAGPKAWAEVPKQVKDLAFRKPFSKKLKEHILDVTYVEMPPQRNVVSETDERDDFDLATLFEIEDEDTEFFGF